MAKTSLLVKMVRSVGSAAFEDKCFAVDGPVIIGRAGALAQPTKNNAIFASFQMSNIHARVFYNHVDCKFLLLDTKSTNGTYIQFKADPTKNKVRLEENKIVTTLYLHHPLGKGKKHQFKEYDCYGNELSPSLLEI